MNLDDKLRDVLKAWHQTGCPFSKDYGKCSNADCDNKKEPLIAQIKQAFAEANYVHVPDVEIVEQWEHGKDAEIIMVNGKAVMTGQEWFNRFKAELNTDLNKYSILEEEDYMEAARRAAGLTEGSK